MPHILLATVGTSLFHPNLEGLRRRLEEGKVSGGEEALARAYAGRDWKKVAAELGRIEADQRICGAEINSITSAIRLGHVAADCGLVFYHSATEEGRAIGQVLAAWAEARGHRPVEAVEIADLQDQDPRAFRTRGLRNLARAMCKTIRDYSPEGCAINATGGYKAQIAVAVLLGQAIGVPVLYKHDRFDEIIAFPPLPVAMDAEVWMQASAMLFDLEDSSEPVPFGPYAEDWDERFDSLVERVAIDGAEYLELTPTGQIFHETFRERFRTTRQNLLPGPAPIKAKPRGERSGHFPAKALEFMGKVTDEVPQVVGCASFYHNPDLPGRIGFRMGSKGLEGIWSDGRCTVKFRVETTAINRNQDQAMAAALNEWLARR